MLTMTGGALVWSQQAVIPQNDTSYIDEHGTAHVTRVVPVPKTISPEAQARLARRVPDNPKPESLADRRSHTDKWQAGAGEEFRKIYRTKVEEQKIAGVPVRVITPPDVPAANQSRVLINLHGGGFNSDSGSLTESIPVAALARTKVISVLYRLAPEHPFPAGLDDVLAVYKEVLKTYQPRRIAIYGTSAGAILTAEVAAKLKQGGMPLPGALGVFSGIGDLSRYGDSRALFALDGLSGHLEVPGAEPHEREYAGATDLSDPILSPLFSDLHGMPPTLFITSTRDLLLSGTCILHRAFLRAGVDSRLMVFEALPHAFWNDSHLPESREAHEAMARFFDQVLGMS
ncbi:MAG: alpha/beta hydrolase fold domain-containing protein [Acidobacteriaceae bacterium]|nr:alpha/beta hydrolase fold domain-containing protein [Acidobacteriaceae bacterium]